MIKLYKNDDDTVHYHEAWERDGVVTEHWGIIGTEGNTREHQLGGDFDPDKAISKVLEAARSGGFSEINEDEHAVLTIEYPIKESFASEEELDRRNDVMERLDQLLGWNGLGRWTGASSGSGTMEVTYLVVDFAVAKNLIENDLRESRFSDFSRIYDERATE